MFHIIAVYFIGVMVVVTFALELWLGCAIAGWGGQNAIICREKSPGPYWFVMFLQAVVIVGAAALSFYRY